MNFNLLNIINLNSELIDTNKLTKEQWRNIIDLAFQMDAYFDAHVVSFYTNYLEFDYVDCEDLLMDIQNGNGDAFERFTEDVINYFDR